MDVDQRPAQGKIAVKLIGKGVYGQPVLGHEIRRIFRIVSDRGGKYRSGSGKYGKGPFIYTIPKSRVIIGLYGAAGIEGQPLVNNIQHLIDIPADFVYDLYFISAQNNLPQKVRPFPGEGRAVQHPFGIFITEQQQGAGLRLF